MQRQDGTRYIEMSIKLDLENKIKEYKRATAMTRHALSLLKATPATVTFNSFVKIFDPDD